MDNLMKIAEINADSTNSAKEIVETLINAGFILVAQEGYPESFYICKKDNNPIK